MAAKRPFRRRSHRPDGRGGPARRGGGGAIGIRRVANTDQWELVHPRCVRQRADDLNEVRQMLAAGETDIARDELIWLLRDCRAFIEAHRVLGELALAENDIELARGHFGYAYELGLAALPREPAALWLPYSRPANRAFFEAGKGLAWCLGRQRQPVDAGEVLNRLLTLDHSDPLQLAELARQLLRQQPKAPPDAAPPPLVPVDNDPPLVPVDDDPPLVTSGQLAESLARLHTRPSGPGKA